MRGRLVWLRPDERVITDAVERRLDAMSRALVVAFDIAGAGAPEGLAPEPPQRLRLITGGAA